MSKQDTVRAIETEVRNCRRCELWRGRRNAVPGEGSLDATIMFVGEAPGYWEDVKGRPFVGAAGKLLDQLLSEIGLSRAEVCITNILKCRPPGNRDPLPREIETCTPYLDRQIKAIKPKFIMTLGRHSTSYVLSRAGFETGGITELHGRVYEADLNGLRAFIIPTFHPAAALYNKRYEDDIRKDLQSLRLELEKRR